MGSSTSKKTKTPRPRRRRTALRLGCVFFALGVAFPLWFGAIAWLVVRFAGIGERAQIESVGYASMSVRAVDVEVDGVRVGAERVSVATPAGWLWRQLTSNPGVAPVSIDGWSVVVDSSEISAEDSEPATPSLAFESYQTFRDQLRRWAPEGSLLSGRIEVDGTILLVDRVDWNRDQISASLELEETGTSEIELSIARPDAMDLTLDAELEGRTYRGSVALGPREGTISVDVRFESEWGSVRIESALTPENWIPDHVDISMREIAIPGDFGTKLGPMGLVGNVRALGTDGRHEWKFQLSQRSESVSEPIILATLSGSSSLDGRLEALDLKTPWAHVALDDPVNVWAEDSGWRWPEATLVVRSASDLSLKGAPLSRPLEATVQLSDTGDLYPRVVISGEGAFPVTEKIGEARVEVDARLDWPKLAVTRLNAGVGEMSQLRLSGEFDGEALGVSNVDVSGTVKLSEFLDWDFASGFPDTFDVEAQADGTLEALRHQGRVKTVASGANPSGAPEGELEMEWRGEGMDAVSVAAGGQVLGFRSSIDANIRLGEDKAEMAIPKLEYGPIGIAPLALEEPFGVQVSGFESGFDNARIQWERMRLSSGARVLELQAAMSGVASGTARALVEKVSLDWLPIPDSVPVEAFEVDRLLAEIGWELGEIHGELEFDGNATIEERRLLFGLDATSQPNALTVERARVSLGDGAGLGVSGKLPLGLRLDGEGIQVISNPNSRMDLRGELDIGPLLDAELPSSLGLAYSDLDGRFRISGTVENPKLGWTFSAGSIDWSPQPESSATWSASDLRFGGTLTRRSLDIQEFVGRLQDSPFRAKASIPLSGAEDGDLLAVGNSVEVDWRRVSASLDLEPARLLDPAIELGAPVYPGGAISIELEVRPPFEVYGAINLDSMSFGPISTLGSFRDFSGQLLFDGANVRARDIAGQYKGRPVELLGEVALPRPESDWKISGDYFARLKTGGIPLAQQSGLIVRSDIDLTLRRADGENPEISGTVRLRDGLLLANANELFTPGAISPEQRPPFFSVDIPPFDQWTLNVEVTGDRFLKAKTPVFQGEISSDLKLTRSLGEPQAIGALRIENGTARFPFANLDITRGSVRLTPENPYRPEVDATANGRLYGYDISARVTGGVDDPRVRLESSPPLRPEAILLMLTTGESPRDTVRLSSAQKRSRLAMYFGNSVLDQLGLGGGDRVSIRTGEDVTINGRVTTSLEYRLNDIWAATLEYDRFNAVNAGMKFRIISR